MSARERLPDRRAHEIVTFECDGHRYHGGIGRFPDGRIAEIFLNGRKVGSAVEAGAQDAAIVASLALQHGCPIALLRHALARSGEATGPLGTLLNRIEDAATPSPDARVAIERAFAKLEASERDNNDPGAS